MMESATIKNKININICFVGDISVGKTTLISALLGHECGTIKRARSTFRYLSFCEDENTHRSPQVEDCKEFSDSIAKYPIPLVSWLDKDGRQYYYNFYDTVGFNDGDLDTVNKELFARIKNDMDLFIVILNVNTNLNPRSERELLELVGKESRRIYVINKFDDPEDEELCENRDNMIKYLTDNEYATNKSDIVVMSSGHIFDVRLRRKNDKKVKSLTCIYGDRETVIDTFGYNKLVKAIKRNTTGNLSLIPIIDKKLNERLEELRRFIDSGETKMSESQVVASTEIDTSLTRIDEVLDMYLPYYANSGRKTKQLYDEYEKLITRLCGKYGRYIVKVFNTLQRAKEKCHLLNVSKILLETSNSWSREYGYEGVKSILSVLDEDVIKVLVEKYYPDYSNIVEMTELTEVFGTKNKFVWKYIFIETCKRVGYMKC